jgi:sortase A
MKTEPRQGRASSWLGRLQIVLTTLGLACLAIYSSARVYGSVSSRLAVWAFQTVRSSTSETTAEPDAPSFSLWSAQRIEAYKRSLALKLDRPLAVLSIPRLQITAPVFDGTDDLTLDRGLGRIMGTGELGQDGNVGIAGHRDGFFRGLKDIVPGDAIEIVTSRMEKLYIVDRTNVVQPGDIRVLERGNVAEITLVTCYPFYYVGSAPSRFIVRASLKQRVVQTRPGIAALEDFADEKEK